VKTSRVDCIVFYLGGLDFAKMFDGIYLYACVRHALLDASKK